MDYVALASGPHGQSAACEYLEHCDIVRQNIGAQFFKPSCAGNGGKMAH